jgi:hypothetical protein
LKQDPHPIVMAASLPQTTDFPRHCACGSNHNWSPSANPYIAVSKTGLAWDRPYWAQQFTFYLCIFFDSGCECMMLQRGKRVSRKLTILGPTKFLGNKYAPPRKPLLRSLFSLYSLLLVQSSYSSKKSDRSEPEIQHIVSPINAV